MDKKKILVINQQHTSNLGDILIGQAMKKILKEYDVEFMPYCAIDLLVSNKKKYWQIIDKIKLTTFIKDIIYRFRNAKLIKDKDYHLAIIGGGELVSANLDFNASMLQWTKILSKKKIPIVIAGVSGNKVSKRIGKRYIRAMERCEMVAVRDQVTKELFENDYGIKAEYCPDFVFGYMKPQNDNKENIVTFQAYNYDYYKGKDRPDNKEEYYDMLYRMALKYVEPDEDIILSYTDVDDGSATSEYRDYVRKRYGITLEMIDMNKPEELIQLLLRTKKIITGRMHPMIVGLLCKNKVVPYVSNDKVRQFKKEWIDQEPNFNDINRHIELLITNIEKYIK